MYEASRLRGTKLRPTYHEDIRNVTCNARKLHHFSIQFDYFTACWDNILTCISRTIVGIFQFIEYPKNFPEIGNSIQTIGVLVGAQSKSKVANVVRDNERPAVSPIDLRIRAQLTHMHKLSLARANFEKVPSDWIGFRHIFPSTNQTKSDTNGLNIH